MLLLLETAVPPVVEALTFSDPTVSGTSTPPALIPTGVIPPALIPTGVTFFFVPAALPLSHESKLDISLERIGEEEEERGEEKRGEERR